MRTLYSFREIAASPFKQLELSRARTTVEVEVDKVRSPHHHNHVLSLTVTAVIAGMLPSPPYNSIHRSSFLR